MAETKLTFDAKRYKQTQHDQWNKDGAGWFRWTSTIQNWIGGVTEAMLELAQVQPGQHVLDIAAGTGEPGLSAAKRVGPAGYILATDLSENILQYAQQIARERGLKNFETRVMDGENLSLPEDSFDVVLCRFGLIFMPNQVRALSEWRRVLKPGGRAVVTVFSTPDRNGWASLPISIIRKHAQLPPTEPGQPGIFSLSNPGDYIGVFEQAGFKDVRVQTISAPLRTRSAQECIRIEREAFGGINNLMAHLSPQERESIWDEVVDEMRIYEGANGFEAPCEPVLGIGNK